MATGIGKVRAVFTASSSGLVSGVNQSVSAMARMRAGVDSLVGSMRTLVTIQGGQLFGSVVSAASQWTSSLVNMGQQQAEVVGRQSELARMLGMNTAGFQGLSLAAEFAGLNHESLAAAITNSEVAFVKAAAGAKVSGAAFASAGLSVESLASMDSEGRFKAIAEAISKLPTASERAAAAIRIFGKSGASLLPMFQKGAAGVEAMQEQAKKLGLTLNNAQGLSFEQMNDSLKMAQKAIEGVVTQVVATLVPAVTAISDQFTKMVGDIGGANIGTAIGDGILQGATWLAGVGDYLIANFGSVFSYLSQVGEQWGAVTDFLSRTASFFSGMWNSAEAAMGMMILDFVSAFQRLAEIAQSIGGYLGFDTSSIDAIVEGAKRFSANIDKGITENVNAASADFDKAFGDSATQAGQAVKGPLSTALSDAIERAKASAAATDAAGKGVAAGAGGGAVAAVEPRALKAIDSRSSEGIAEMFRILRGEGGGVQEKQLGVLEEIRDELADPGEDVYLYGLE